MLSDYQVAHYKAFGFVVIRQVLSLDEISVHQALRALLLPFPPPGEPPSQ